jgi:hypothetical protein
MSTRVFKFGILSHSISDELKELLGNSLFYANCYQNECIKLILEDRVKFNEIRSRITPGLPEAEQRVNELKAKLEEEGTKILLSRAEKALKKLKQTNNKKQIEHAKATVDELKKKLAEEGTAEELKKAQTILKPLKQQYKKILENDDPILKAIKKSVVESTIDPKTDSYYTYEQYSDKKHPNKIGPNSAIRRELKQKIHDAIMESDKLSDLTKELEQRSWDGDRQYKYTVYSTEKRLSHGTKNERYNSAEQAHKDVIECKAKKGKFSKGLRFKPFDMSGKLTNQLTENKSIAQVMEGNCSAISISMYGTGEDYNYADDNRWEDDCPNWHKNAKVLFQIGTGKEAQFIEFETRIHRKIPADALVKRASIKATRVGPTVQFELILSLEGNSLDKEASGPKDKICALDVGWRQEGQTLRAGCIGDRNEQEIILLPKQIVSGLEKADEIKKARDICFNHAKEVFAASKDILMDMHDDDAARYIHMTRSPKKLIKLLRRYREFNNHDLWNKWKQYRGVVKGSRGDNSKEDLFVQKPELDTWLATQGITDEAEQYWLFFEWWVRKNNHLFTYESGLRNRMLRSRKDFYRNIAARYAKKYGCLIIEDMIGENKHGLSDLAETTNSANKPNANRFKVSPSELVAAMINAFGPANVKKLDAANTSKICSKCGGICSSEEGSASLYLTCEDCLTVWDRDKNAVQNLCSKEWDDPDLTTLKKAS